MQRIVIKNFGPIKEVDIPIHDFMIFIGPQASGKSTIAKAIYFFKDNLIGSILNSLLALNKTGNLEVDKRNIYDAILDKFDKVWKYYPTGYHELHYEYADDYWVKIKYRKLDETEFNHGIQLSKSLTDALNQIILSIYNIIETTTPKYGYSYPGVSLIVSEFISKAFGLPMTVNFIPAGRSVFSILANQVQLVEGDRIDETIKIFAGEINYTRIKEFPPLGLNSHPNPILTKALELYRSILKGSFIHEKNSDKIQLGEGLEIPIEKASSGQQEALWPLLILFSLIKEREKNLIIFEEPEAHLYPEAQKQIADLVTLAVNQKGNTAILTTHSPYILGAINNLIYANEVGKINPEKVEKIVDKNLWLDYDRVMAYFVDNGGVRSIMDAELRTIKNEEIDSASRIINEEYDKLSDIEFSK